MHYHTGLLLAFFAAFGYTLATFFFKAAVVRGATGMQLNLWANVALAVVAFALAAVVFAVRALNVESLGMFETSAVSSTPFYLPILMGATLFCGQVCVFFALARGDVSVITPLLGTKIVMIAALNWLIFAIPAGWHLWMAAAFATLGVAVITGIVPQASKKSSLATGGLALAAAFFIALADTFVENWAGGSDPFIFVPTAFATMAVLSVALCAVLDPSAFRIKKEFRFPLACGAVLLGVESTCVFLGIALSRAAAAVGIVYSLRSLLTVVAAWFIGRYFGLNEQSLPRKILLVRLVGALLLFAAIFLIFKQK